MTEKSSAYYQQYNRENTKVISVRVQNSEYQAFSDLCAELSENKQNYLKRLVNEDCKQNGRATIFKENINRGQHHSEVEVPSTFIDAIEYAAQNGIKRTTMLQRLRAGKYQSAIHVDASWYIDPNEIYIGRNRD